ATIGLGFAFLVSGGITRPVRQLLQGTREIEAGRLEKSLIVSTRDEIGEVSVAFNRMVEQLRRNQRIRETFGRYIDPKIAEGLIDRPDVAAIDGQRRVMTVMFCDLKGFTSMSEGVTPQGLVKIVNCYLSMMSEPIRENRGIIDKYIGDAIMAYWGPPFIEERDQAAFACNAALEMSRRLPDLQRRIPELLGLRRMSIECDIRIGIATGEMLAGSIGIHDEFHRDGRCGKPRLAARRGEQGVRERHSAVGSHGAQLRRRLRGAGDRPDPGDLPVGTADRLRTAG